MKTEAEVRGMSPQAKGLQELLADPEAGTGGALPLETPRGTNPALPGSQTSSLLERGRMDSCCFKILLSHRAYWVQWPQDMRTKLQRVGML